MHVAGFFGASVDEGPGNSTFAETADFYLIWEFSWLSFKFFYKLDFLFDSQHIRMLSGLDTAWVTNTNNGLHAHGHPSWRNVQLETAKLLELGCVLPATILPHFQMYRWAFVGSQHDYCSSDIVNGNEQENLPVSKFIPHVTRIAQLMDFRYTSHSPVS